MFTESKKTVRLSALKVTSLLGAGILFAAGAHAQQAADAGQAVSNTFTLDYSVNNTPQPRISNDPGELGVTQGIPTVFTVDRLVDLLLVQTNSPQNVAPGTNIQLDGGGALLVAPDQQPSSLSFDLTNSGNDNQSYSFSFEDLGGDSFTATGLRIFYELSGGGFAELTTVATASTGATAQITEDLAPGETRAVFVLGNIPAAATDAQFDDITLIAQTRDPQTWLVEGAPAAPGAATVSNNGDGNNLLGLAQNVFADGDGVGTEGDFDGLFSDTGRFVIVSPNLQGAKTVAVVATDGTQTGFDCAAFDPAPGTPTLPPFATPGACVEYVITVTNGGSSDPGATAAETIATGIDVIDILPDGLRFLSAQATGFTTGTHPDGVTALTAPTASVPALNTNCNGGVECRVAFEDGALLADPGNPASVTIRAIIES